MWRPCGGGDPPTLPTTRRCVSHGSSSSLSGEPGADRTAVQCGNSCVRPSAPTAGSCIRRGPLGRPPRTRHVPKAGDVAGGRRMRRPGTRITRTGIRVPFYATSIVGEALRRQGNRSRASHSFSRRRCGACVARMIPGERIARRPATSYWPEFPEMHSSILSLSQFLRGVELRDRPVADMRCLSDPRITNRVGVREPRDALDCVRHRFARQHAPHRWDVRTVDSRKNIDRSEDHWMNLLNEVKIVTCRIRTSAAECQCFCCAVRGKRRYRNRGS